MSGRRSHGDGTVYYDKKRDRYVVEVIVGRKDGKPDRRRRTAATKREANRIRQELVAQVTQGKVVPTSRTLEDWMERWFANVRVHNRSPETVSRDRRLAQKHIYPVLGGRRLKDLRPEDVEALLVAMLKAPKDSRRPDSRYARATLDRVKCVLRMALAEAERRQEVAWNVAAIVATPTKRPGEEDSAVTDPQRRAMTEDQAQALLAALKGHAREALWLSVLLLGLRPGEVCGLTWDDIDFDQGRLHVRRHRRGQGEDMHLGDPKTRKSRRTLDMPPQLVEALRRHRTEQAKVRLHAGSAWQDLGLVFPTETGRFIDGKNLRKELDRITRKAELGHWSPYELRHSCVSLLSAAGVPIEEVADLVGHVDTTMTMTVYRHPVRPSVSAHMEAMTALADGKPGR